jgi:hypothetical protein
MKPTEPKTILAGAISTMSFARFTASMARFNEERAPSRSFGRCEFAAMVEGGGSSEKPAWRTGCEERFKP